MISLILVIVCLVGVMVFASLLTVVHLLDRQPLRALAAFTLTIAAAVAWWWLIVRL